MNPANAAPASTGRKYWRSLAELEGKPEFDDYLRREFPVSGDQFPDGMSRRRWLQLMGASLTLAGAVGCRYEKEIIAPFAQRPQNRIPGKPQRFATTIEYAGSARPLLMTCYDGRPVKAEGNPKHPDSSGGTDAYTQASALELYDPDRASAGYEIVDGRANELEEDELRRRVDQTIAAIRGKTGATVFLTETTESPTFARLMSELATSANVEWVQFSPISDDNERAGLKQAFGEGFDVVARPLLEKAKTILALDVDFIAADLPGTVRLQDAFVAGREPDDRRMNRLYCVESQFSMTGMKADHRLGLRSSLIGSFLAEVYQEVTRLKGAGEIAGSAAKVAADKPSRAEVFLAALAEDLAAASGDAVVIVGRNQPPEVHALAARLNSAIGAIGATVNYLTVPTPRPVGVDAIAGLAERLQAGQIQNLVVIGGNPAYDAPVEVDFASAMERAETVVRLGMYVDETSLKSDLHLPMLHVFETWGDVISPFGVWSVSQPMIDPLHGGWSAITLAAETLGGEADSQALVRATARDTIGAAGEIAWRRIVRDGFVEGSESPATTVAVTSAEPEFADLLDPSFWREDSEKIADALELTFFPCRKVYDGRFANNGWLQELPDPISKLTWDNCLYVHPQTARALGLSQGMLASVSVSGGEIVAPVFIQPGQALGSLAIALGYGRRSAGKIGGSATEGIDPPGFDVATVRRGDAWWFVGDVSVKNVGTPYKLATTQDHNAIDDLGLREIANRAPQLVREGTFADYVKFMDGEHEAPHGEAEARGGASDTAPIDSHSPEEKESHSAEVAKGTPALDHSHDDHDHDETHAAGHHRQFPPRAGHHPALVSLWTEWSYEGQAWGMAIDLNKCTGCNACVVACQAENNIPIVGKEMVARNRELHWLRIDRYFSGDPDNPSAVSQPMLCQQCENAPCESVCPVAATVHSTEGLNDMVYNRCIGTRYCGNNCPYKVRRFNYLWYRGNPRLNQDEGDLTNLVLNPEVTVRTRGVMEKCTFCVQRIQNAKIEAKAERRPLGAEEIQTACQQACPTGGIVFGDLNREESRAAQLHRSPRAYAMLEELNVKPRNRYLARITNPHPALEKWERDREAGV